MDTDSESDACPDDPEKTEPGLCGCGVPEGSCDDELGTGLKAAYFDDADLTEHVLDRVDPVVGFDWDMGSPDPAIGADTFSVRWTGFVKPEFTDDDTFYTKTDDGVHLWVDNKPLISSWSTTADAENQASIFLEGGIKVPVSMEYFDDTGQAFASLMWSSAQQPQEVIPKKRLYPADPEPDSCPNDSSKTEPGECGCGVAENVCDDVPDPGLKGEYFNDDSLTEQVFVRIDPVVGFDWGRGSPDPEIESDTFSVRWTGDVTAKYTEPYFFHTVSDDGVRLWVDDQLIINNWEGLGEKIGTIPLVARQSHSLKMEYFDGLRNAVVRLLWSSASQPKEVIPQEQLIAE